MISSLSYRAFGATSVVSYGNGRRLTLGYDTNRHQMVSMLVDNQNGTDRIIDKTYYYTTQSSQQTYYDNDGRIKQITDNLDPNYTATYTYDAFNRLASARGGSQLWPTYYRNYSYDEWGNLYNVQTSSDWQNATSYSVGQTTNRVNSVSTKIYGWTAQTVNYTWDASGNLTNDGLRTYTYDAAGRQKEAGAVGQNTVGYDGDGQRVRKVENWGTPIYYVRSSMLKNAAMEVVNGTLARAYVLQKGQVIAEQSADGQFYWAHTDHLGSGRKLTNTSGVVVYRGEFDPHGQSLLETGSALLNSHKYTGYERDQTTGLDYASARMYASNTARFTSPDPDWLRAASKSSPQSYNRYSYTLNDPVNLIDPTGLGPISPGTLSILCELGIIGWWDCAGGSSVRIETKAGDERGGGGITIEPLPSRVREPKLTYETLYKGTATDCGGGQVNIRWNISDKAGDMRGWIVQYIEKSVRLTQSDGTPYTWSVKYWEAWYVNRKGSISARVDSDDGSDVDIWQFNWGGENTEGEATYKAWAKLFIGKNQIKPNPVTWGIIPDLAGDLYATQDPPDNWGGKSGLSRSTVVKWNCRINPPQKTTIK